MEGGLGPWGGEDGAQGQRGGCSQASGASRVSGAAGVGLGVGGGCRGAVAVLRSNPGQVVDIPRGGGIPRKRQP